ncbi:MAG: NAD(P)H-dependent oxidoreductase subunit E, partial [Acidimicrobiia bacterium]|nr:NAD(P)H-dependent oxidoreductase subunit E [Acidimicrobiia bacterium]
MDLRFIGAEVSEGEREAIHAAVPAAEVVEVDGRVVRTDRTSLRHHLLPALDAVQSAIGYVSEGAVDEIARRLHVPPAEVYSVATFYALIQTEPRPPVVAHVCDDVACRSAADLVGELGDRDDVVASPCLGQCDRRPAVFFQRAGSPDLVAAPATASEVSSVLDGAESITLEPTVDAGPLLRRVGRVDPGSLDAFRSTGGYVALARAIEMGPEAVIAELETSGLKGRGGAAFPAGVKWESVRKQPTGPKYVVCNADESEPGTFKDRVVLEGDPFAVIEALTIAGFSTGATKGFIYIRGEYPLATERQRTAVAAARNAGLLGDDVAGAGFAFDIEVRRGQGAYICGEETALFNSIEGFRGEPRQKPPFPVFEGLFGRPTVINNVETLINVNRVLTEGGETYAASGTPDSTGTRLFCLSGDVARPGVYEVEFGMTLGDLIERAGGAAGDLGFVMLGGAAGSLVDASALDLRLTFEDARAAGVSLGSGVVMVFNTEVDMVDIVRRIARFFRDESCGQCVPCRVGTARVEEAVSRANGSVEASLIEDMDRAMKDASICGLGHTAASVV